MLDFHYADQQIADNPPLIREMTNLVSLMIDKKKFVFHESEIDFDISLLISNNSVLVLSGKVQVKDDYLLCYIFYRRYAKILSFSLSGSLEKLFAFLQQLGDNAASADFDGHLSFLQNVNAVALYHQHCQFQPDLLIYINTLPKEENSVLYTFSDSYCKMLPYQRSGDDILLGILRTLYTLHDFGQPGIYSYNIVELDAAVRKFAIANKKDAYILLDNLLAAFDDINENMAISIIVGLRAIDSSVMPKLEELTKNELYQPLVVTGLSYTHASLDDIKTNLLLVEGIKNDSKRYQSKLPAFYSAIVNNESITDTEIIGKCFDVFKQLIIKDDLDFPTWVLQSLASRKNHEKQKFDLLLALMNEGHFQTQLTPLISYVFFEFADCNYYMDFLHAFALKTGFALDERIFEHGAFRLRNLNPEKFDTELVEFLVHDIGEIRWMGQRLLKKLRNHRGKFFACNILDLPPKSQLKLFISVLSMTNEPGDFLPALLPLIQTSSEFVKESLINRIEVLAEDYGKQVLKVLEAQWQDKTVKQQQVFDRIQKYGDEFSAEMDKRIRIKELNPFYVQSSYLNSYLNSYRKVFERDMNASVEKNSIFHQLAATTHLSRAGGWRHQQTGEITQLSTVATNFTLPSNYFVSPDNYEWNKNKERHQNWSKFLDEWEAIF